MHHVLFFLAQDKESKSAPGVGGRYGELEERELCVTKAGLRLKESGKMVRLIKEENLCGARGDCKHL